jgi:hypothetical protein
LDLKSLLSSVEEVAPTNKVVLAPASPDRAAREAMAMMRNEGYVVVGRLGDVEDIAGLQITHVMEFTEGKWQIKAKGM